MINTGVGPSFTMRKDKARYLKTSPGIGSRSRVVLIKQKSNACRGGQTVAWRSGRIPSRKVNLPIHAMFLIVNGVSHC